MGKNCNHSDINDIYGINTSWNERVKGKNLGFKETLNESIVYNMQAL